MTTVATPGSGLWPELLGFGLAIALNPLHVGLLLLVLLGPSPLRRGSWFVVGWLITTLLIESLLLWLGHGLLLSMEKGSSHRTGLDLLGAGALLALGLHALQATIRREGGKPSWAGRLEDLSAISLPTLLAVSALLQVASPDDLFLYTKAAGGLLASGRSRTQELLAASGFSLVTAAVLVLPLLAMVMMGEDRTRPLLERFKGWLLDQGDLLMAGVSLLLAAYLGWQGIEGLRAGI